MEILRTMFDNRRKLRNCRPGWVYLIRCTKDDTLCKIGWSTCPARRVTEVADLRACYVDHEIVSADAPMIERTLHERFSERRIEGSEWFVLTPKDIEMLKLVTHADEPQDLPAFLLPNRLLQPYRPNLHDPVAK